MKTRASKNCLNILIEPDLEAGGAEEARQKLLDAIARAEAEDRQVRFEIGEGIVSAVALQLLIAGLRSSEQRCMPPTDSVQNLLASLEGLEELA